MTILDTSQKLSSIFFGWDEGRSKLILHDKTLKDALTIAREFGYTPRIWYKPRTWENTCTVFDLWSSVRISAKQQKSLLSQG